MDMWMDVDAALAEVPVNLMPLIDSTDFVTVEDAIAFDAAGMDLRWNFVTTGGAYTSTAVTPTSAGNYDWAHQGDGMYSIEIPASGGASINNDTEGFGWFSGKITGVLPFRGPVIGFRAAGLNDLLIDSAFSTTRGLAGTALPAAAADGAGGLPISDAGGLDLDAQVVTKINDILTDTGTTLQAELDGIQADTEDIQSKLGTPSDLGGGATVAANLVVIEGQTDDIGAAGAGLTALATAAELAKVPKSDSNVTWNATALASIQSESNDALVAYDPPTRAELTSDINSVLARLRWVVIVDGTIGATGNDTTHVHLPGLTYGNDEINGYMLVVYDVSEDEYHWRKITDWVLATELATVDALPFTPQNSTDTYALLASLADASVTGGDATAANQATIIGLLGTPADLGSGATVGDNLTDIAGSGFVSATDGLAANQVEHDATQAELAKVPKSDSNVTWNATAAAQIQSEANDALVAYDPPTNTEMVAAFTEIKGATWATTDTLEAIRDRGDAAWVTATGFSTHSAADVWVAATRTLTSAANITSTGGTTVPQTGDSFARIGATGSGLTSLAQASVATEARLAELDAANIPADLDQVKADLPSRPTKNTALANFPFVMVDETDGFTAETGLTVTATRSLDGAAFGACANAVSEVGNGVYKITLATADMNADTVVLKFTATGARTRLINIVTQP